VSASVWRIVNPTVLAAGAAPVSWSQEVLGACLALDGVASHETAARLHGMAYVNGNRVVVSVGTNGHRRIGPAIVHRSTDLQAEWRMIIDSIPVTTPARTIVDLSGVMGPVQLEHVLDHALGCRILSIEDAIGAFDALARRGRHGVAQLRPILLERSDGVVVDTSELERLFTRLVRRAGLPEPDRQLLLGRERLIGQVDFVYRDRRLIVEVDGRLGHSQVLDFEKDRRRDQEALVIGMSVVRFTYRQITRRPDQVEEVLRALLCS
jgi:very-short-patch-repair endonuclease